MLQKVSTVYRRALLFFVVLLCLCGSKKSSAQEQLSPIPDTPAPQPGVIVGTVVDVNDDAIPGATVILDGPNARGPRTVLSNDKGSSYWINSVSVCRGLDFRNLRQPQHGDYALHLVLLMWGQPPSAVRRA